MTVSGSVCSSVDRAVVSETGGQRFGSSIIKNLLTVEKTKRKRGRGWHIFFKKPCLFADSGCQFNCDHLPTRYDTEMQQKMNKT